MKRIYILSMRLRSFWVMTPLTMILILSIMLNSRVDGPTRLYPLITISAGGIIFSLIYFFRAVMISYSEIKNIGRFSDRDGATIEEGKTLLLEFDKGSRVNIRLYGNEGYNPDIKWLTTDDETGGEICIFRSKTYSGIYASDKILTYFGVDRADFSGIYADEDIVKEYENVTVSTSYEYEKKIIRIRINKTI